MLYWNHKDIGDAFSLLIDLNKSLHSMKQIDEVSLIEISGALKLFLTKLSPMIGETILNDRKRIKQDRLERKRLNPSLPVENLFRCNINMLGVYMGQLRLIISFICQ
jgi:hypothetical protein